MPNVEKYHFWKLVLMLAVMSLNAVMIVALLNSSLFADFVIDDINHVNASFYSGASLIFLITVLVYAIIGTLSVTIVFTDIMFGILAISNHIKVEDRNAFTTFPDVQKIFTAPGDLLSFAGIPIVIAIILLMAIILLLVTLQLVTIRLSRETQRPIHKNIRVVFFIVGLTTLSAIAMKPNIYNEYVLGYEQGGAHDFNPLQKARMDGYLPSFMHTVDPVYMSRPEGYSQSTMTEIEETYTEVAANINTTRKEPLNNSQTILYLSESLMNPDSITDLLHNQTPIPYISDQTKNGIGGTMYSQYIGGGTANLEWSIITSFSTELFLDPVTTTPYSDFYMQSNNHQTILDQYKKDKTIALHPYTAHLYNRKEVYDAIGFDQFLYLNHGIFHTDKLADYQTVSDEALNKDILRFAGEDDVGYLHVLTMQNHLPYEESIPSMDYDPQINTDIFPADREKKLSNYLQGLKASDEAVKNLLQKLNETAKDINFVFFGDHLPNLFRGLEDRFTREQLHETPWFIYMNHGRGEENVQFEGLSPMFFIPVLLKEGDYKVTPFQGLLDQMLAKGVKRIGRDYVVTESGKVSDADMPEDIMSLVHDYRIIQYDALFGHDWLADAFYSLDE